MAKKRKAAEPKPKEVIKQEDEETSSSEEEQEETSSSSSSSSSSEEEEESSSEAEDDDSDSSSSSSEEEEDHQSDDESSKRSKLRKLLEPFGKDQIIGLLKEAASNDPSILSRIIQKAESDPTHRKIFIHGIGWDATEEQLRQVFKPFGEIEECKLITDKATGRAKGYAFVLFKTLAATKKALKNPQKKIGNRITSCQLAALGPAASAAGGTVVTDVRKRKLFVANVGPSVNVDRLRAFFGKFGEIEDGPLGLDPSSNRPRGFAIFVYKSVDGLNMALEEPVKLFEGCQLNCKKFVEGLNSGNANNKNSGNQQPDDGSYGFGVNSGILGSNLNAGGLLMQQNPGIGLIGNSVLAVGFNPFNPTAELGPALTALGGNYGNYGINAISPSVIGSYGSQAALQGLGAYQSAQMGQSSVGAAPAGGAVGTGAARPQSGVVSAGMSLPSYFGR